MKRLATTIAAVLFGLSSAATAKPVSANITLMNDSQFACFIVSADAKNIRYSLDESGTGVSTVPRNQVKTLITRPPEEWTEAKNTYGAGDYETAEAQFRKLAEEYAPISALKDEYGSLAKFYYLQTLKKNGKLALLADEIDKMRSQTVVLSTVYADQAKWLVPWGFIGKKNWDGLLGFVGSFVDTANQKDNPTPPFTKGIAKSKAAELAYFRAIATENKEGPDAASRDYYRALTLAYGSDRQISREAILALLKITKTAEDKAESYFNKSELYTLSSLYKQTFGKGELPPEYARYLTPPPDPSGLTTEPEKEATDKPEKEDPKPDEDKPGDDKPAEDKPAEDKPAEDKPAEDKPAEDKPSAP